jgi:hypothetical protein
MDPDAAYEALSADMARLRRHVDADVGNPPAALVDDAVTHWDALDGWMAKGGYPPRPWLFAQLDNPQPQVSA